MKIPEKTVFKKLSFFVVAYYSLWRLYESPWKSCIWKTFFYVAYYSPWKLYCICKKL